MQWVNSLFVYNDAAAPGVLIAQAVMIISLVAMAGLALGAIKFRGLGLGIAGVLFAGLAFGHFNLHINEHILHFAREFGLILFVYTIGVQVGPGFFSSLKKQGLKLNLMATTIVLGGSFLTILLWKLFMTPPHLAAAVGLLAGATTNTPSLAAAQQALADHPKITPELRVLPGQAYAVAYPFGILGIILTMLLVKWIFRVNLDKETAQLKSASDAEPPLQNANIEIHNPNLHGIALKNIPLLSTTSVVISRVYRDGKSELAKPDTTLSVGDVIHAVGVATAVADLKILVGKESKLDLRHLPSDISAQRILVSKGNLVNKTLGELAIPARFGVNVTRITRAGIDLPVTLSSRLQAGDFVTIVGDKTSIANVASELGNSSKQLSHPQLIGVFLGIALGVLVGSIPVVIPGLPAPLKLGLAAGPMIVAILLSYIRRIGPIVWYMPSSANLMVRELGIVLFMACVGLKGGAGFIDTIKANGTQWMLMGAAITITPLLIIGLVGRGLFRLNYHTLCGLLAGSMTDPPALAFAQNITGSDAATVSYATVYPLTMLLRVFSTQIIVLTLFAP